MNSSPSPSDKPNLHPRNLHRFRYDFDVLITVCPELKPFVSVNNFGSESINFSNPTAVKMLNRAILAHFYKIDHWDIPPHYLCPPIPGRADYVHYLADLLANGSAIPMGQNVVGLDVGIGANCVYPIIGHQSYGWSFVGSDIDAKALKTAQLIVASNATLKPFVECRLQPSAAHIFKNIVQPNDRFDFTICNPPFHASQADAMAGTERKWQNLDNSNAKQKNERNFGGQPAELWCEGGEMGFISKMIQESGQIAQKCLWFTTLVSKQTTLPAIYKLLKKAKAANVETVEMAQGKKISRFVAWTFLSNYEQKSWKESRW
jgi:23S rRNA (adenine1618-N6)-methyltransferase